MSFFTQMAAEFESDSESEPTYLDNIINIKYIINNIIIEPEILTNIHMLSNYKKTNKEETNKEETNNETTLSEEYNEPLTDEIIDTIYLKFEEFKKKIDYENFNYKKDYRFNKHPLIKYLLDKTEEIDIQLTTIIDSDLKTITEPFTPLHI